MAITILPLIHTYFGYFAAADLWGGVPPSATPLRTSLVVVVAVTLLVSVHLRRQRQLQPQPGRGHTVTEINSGRGANRALVGTRKETPGWVGRSPGC